MLDRLSGDRYETPEGIAPCPREYVLLKTRWSPYSKFFGIMFRARALAVRGLYDDAAWARSSLDVIAGLERYGARFMIEGLDQLRSFDGPAVFVANHMSTLETLTLPGLIQPIKPCTYVVKEKLMHGIIWGPIMRSRNPIAVTRADPRRDLDTVLREGKKHLDGGRSVIVFPQGTRTETFAREGLNSLGVKLAIRAGVPVVPVALKTDYWGNSWLFRGFGPVRRDRTIHIEFGAPVPAAGRGKAEHEAVLDFIEGRLRAWGARMADQDAGAASPASS